MIRILNKNLIALSILVISATTLANDCSWSELTVTEQHDLLAGKSVMKNSTHADGVRSQIDQWAFSKNPDLFSVVANFYDVSEFHNAGDVADISLADGSHRSDNPIILNVVPKADNMFGRLYQPFSFSSRVKTEGDGYNIYINYLSSPGLIKHVANNISFCVVENKVLVRFLSTVTDNPKLPITGGVFGWAARRVLWKRVFLQDMERADQPSNAVRIENLKKALTHIVE